MIRKNVVKLISALVVVQLAACASNPTQQVRKPVVKKSTVVDSAPLPRRERLKRLDKSSRSSTKSRINAPRNKPSAAVKSNSPVLTKLLSQANGAAALNQWSKAENYLERAISIDSRNAQVWQRLSEIKMAQDKPHQAIQFARKSITLAGNDRAVSANGWKIVSEANTRLNKPAKARAALDKFNELSY